MSADKSEVRLEELFKACDFDGSGFIDKSELRQLCADLELTDFDDVFKELDQDADGRISMADFRSGFRSVSSLFSQRRSQTQSSPKDVGQFEESAKDAHRAWQTFVVDLELGYYLLSPTRYFSDLHFVLSLVAG